MSFFFCSDTHSHSRSYSHTCTQSFILFLQLLFYPFAFQTPWQGAQTSIHCAVAEELEGVTGKQFVECRMTDLKLPPSLNDKAGEKLWRISAEMTGLQ